MPLLEDFAGQPTHFKDKVAYLSEIPRLRALRQGGDLGDVSSPLGG
jgi:hypothetical protein